MVTAQVILTRLADRGFRIVSATETAVCYEPQNQPLPALQNLSFNYLGTICNAPSEEQESPVKQGTLHITEYSRNAEGV
jgi:hypothetical protein